MKNGNEKLITLSTRQRVDQRKIGTEAELTHSQFPRRTTEEPWSVSRVTCEPYVKIGQDYAHPDVVVWGDGAQCTAINSGEFPILWACEVKYKSSVGELDNSNDLTRMRQLVESDWGHYACCLEILDLSLDNKDHKVLDDMSWEETSRGGLLVWRLSACVG